MEGGGDAVLEWMGKQGLAGAPLQGAHGFRPRCFPCLATALPPQEDAGLPPALQSSEALLGVTLWKHQRSVQMGSAPHSPTGQQPGQQPQPLHKSEAPLPAQVLSLILGLLASLRSISCHFFRIGYHKQASN